MPVPLTPAMVSPTRRGHKKETTCGFLLLVNLPLSLRGHGENRRDETAPKRGTAEDFFFRRGAQCAPIPLPIRSARYSAATHAVPSPQARHKVNCPKGKRRSPGGYPCRATLWHVVTEGTCEFRYSLQFIFAGPVYHNVLTNRAALLSPRGPSLCPSGNSPCAALCVDYTTCVAERYLTLRICGYMDVQSASCGRKNPLSRPYSLSSLIFAVLSPRETGVPRG